MLDGEERPGQRRLCCRWRGCTVSRGLNGAELLSQPPASGLAGCWTRAFGSPERSRVGRACQVLQPRAKLSGQSGTVHRRVLKALAEEVLEPQAIILQGFG